MATYQDKWSHGRSIGPGYRECAHRYELVRDFCRRFVGPFSVCDIGANMCYFGLRLTEEFPECTVVAFEYDHIELRRKHLREAGAERILLLNHHLSLTDLELLSTCCRFDVILALSVLHHLSGPFRRILCALRNLGDNVIAEFALDDSRRTHARKDYRIPSDAVVLGYGSSHLDVNVERPLVVFPGAFAKRKRLALWTAAMDESRDIA